MNVHKTFQREMDIAFDDKNDRFIVIYLDDMIVFSKIEEDHINHLQQIFRKCRRYGLSLNPKKYFYFP
jgi:hypothetical protein